MLTASVIAARVLFAAGSRAERVVLISVGLGLAPLLFVRRQLQELATGSD